ncbi:hypothetical protein FKR81_14845 [Lentzea tibetensis]|uniref:Uncharacterized protein n=1 Tax=Lentzea tibetensis TaxID=2591470 RepID=A0A563EWG9_9PSEU|nr:hypothetical protein [Lentzea tibetensis]TWP51484.1 hypothetical protein FKR81_14845 [Lentzea tibetensis]
MIDSTHGHRVRSTLISTTKEAQMSSVTAIRPVHKPWLVFTARAVVVLQALGIVFLLTSIWTTVAIAVLFVVTVSVVRALSRASQQMDTIFEEELS